MVEMWREIYFRVSRHPRLVAAIVGFYLLLAALGWWGSVPPPLGSIGIVAPQSPWSLPALPTSGGDREGFTKLIATPPWPPAAGSESEHQPGSQHRIVKPPSSRAGPRVGSWSLVGIVNPLSGVSRALFLSPDSHLHRVRSGGSLPGQARLVFVGADFILIHRHGQNRLRRLYAPVAPTASSNPAIPPRPQSSKSGS